MVRREWSSSATVVADEGFAFTWRGVAGLILALGIVGLVIVAGGFLVGFSAFGTRSEIDRARNENIALLAQQEALRNRAFELVERSIEAVERAQRIARLSGAVGRDWEVEVPPLLARNTGNEALLDWLSGQQALLAAVDEELVAAQADTNATGLGSTPDGAMTAPPDAPGAARTASVRRQKVSRTLR